jgi:carbon storage regulator CsrA
VVPDVLVLSRKVGERVRIRATVGGSVATVWVTVIEWDRGHIRLGFDGGEAVEFAREELLDPKDQYPNNESKRS